MSDVHRHARTLSYSTHSMVSHRLSTSRPMQPEGRVSLPTLKMPRSEDKRGRRRRRADTILEQAYSTASSKPVV